MTILLVRHAESAANIDDTYYHHTPDHAIPLTEKGIQQAHDVGVFIQDYFKNNPSKNTLKQGAVRLWSSPYLRTTQTALELRKAAPDLQWDHASRGNDIHFDERLREREWGAHPYHDYGVSTKLKDLDPVYHDFYFMTRNSKHGRYYTKPKGGESTADVALRLRSFFHDLYFDINRGITDHVIVTHGLTMLAFIYAFTKGHPDFFDAEIMGNNTAVRLLDKDPQTERYADYGFIYDPAHNLYLLDKPEKPIIRDINELFK